MKLEIKHLAPYLPYGLKCHTGEETNCTLIGLKEDSVCYSEYDYKTPNCGDTIFTRPSLWMTLGGIHKPILKPLDNVYVKIEGFEFYNSNMIINAVKFGGLPIKLWLKLVEHHYDVFNLIPEGLAIDINTLNHD